jgi:hypothetical protein
MTINIVPRKLEWSTKPQIIVKPGAEFSIVSFVFHTLTKYLWALNAAKYNISITTYRKSWVMQKCIDVKLDVKVPSHHLMRSLSMYLHKWREDKQQQSWQPKP